MFPLEKGYPFEELSLDRPGHVALHDADGHDTVFFSTGLGSPSGLNLSAIWARNAGSVKSPVSSSRRKIRSKGRAPFGQYSLQAMQVMQAMCAGARLFSEGSSPSEMSP